VDEYRLRCIVVDAVRRKTVAGTEEVDLAVWSRKALLLDAMDDDPRTTTTLASLPPARVDG
jgi:hypothetical protein